MFILDDFGLHDFDDQSREILLDVTDEQYSNAPTIMSCLIPVSTLKLYGVLFGNYCGKCDFHKNVSIEFVMAKNNSNLSSLCIPNAI